VIGTRIAQLRKQAGLTQQELGPAAGLHGQTISDLERGVNTPVLTTLVAIAQALGIPLSELVDEPQPEPEVAATP
jgi:transcriptional regulator with XRE-family HTH domain